VILTVVIVPLPGWTSSILVDEQLARYRTQQPRCTVMKPWALAGRKLWVRPVAVPKVRKGVSFGMELCAELLRLPR